MAGALGTAAAIGGLAQIASIGSAFWLGGRLLRRAIRSGGVPERLLGLHLFLSIGLGSLLLSVASMSAYTGEAALPAWFVPLAATGNLVTIFGLMAALWFNYHVFHEGQRAGLMVAVAASALMWIGFALYARAGGLESRALYGRESWPYVAAMVVADLWVVFDALRFRSHLMRRLALGLADPLVVDRLQLWGIASLARIGLVLMAPIMTAFVHTQELRAQLAPWLLALSAFLILATCVSLWLMLAPGERYRRWVAARYAVAAS